MYSVVSLVLLAINVLTWLIIIDAILSWVPDLRYRWREATRILEQIVGPILSPFRRLVPPSKTGGLDISPLLAIVSLNLLESLIRMYL